MISLTLLDTFRWCKYAHLRKYSIQDDERRFCGSITLIVDTEATLHRSIDDEMKRYMSSFWSFAPGASTISASAWYPLSLKQQAEVKARLLVEGLKEQATL